MWTRTWEAFRITKPIGRKTMPMATIVKMTHLGVRIGRNAGIDAVLEAGWGDTAPTPEQVQDWVDGVAEVDEAVAGAEILRTAAVLRGKARFEEQGLRALHPDYSRYAAVTPAILGWVPGLDWR